MSWKVPFNGHSERQVTSRLSGVSGDGTMARLTILVALIALNATALRQQLFALQQTPSSPAVVSVESADELIKQGHLADAIQALVELASSPQPPKGVQRELGIAFYRSGQLMEAEKRFRGAMSDDPTENPFKCSGSRFIGLTGEAKRFLISRGHTNPCKFQTLM